MEYRLLGRSGLKVSVLSYGAWVTFGNQTSEDDAFKCMKEAYDAGCNFFDNAEVYASGQAETVMGKTIKRLYSECKVERSDLVVSTKIFWGGKGVNKNGLSRKHVIEGTKAALARLQLEYVYLIFCHRPDPQTPMQEIVMAFNCGIDQGWAFYWGTSEWSAAEIERAMGVAHELGLIAPIMDQPQYSMLHRTRVEAEYDQLYKEYSYGMTIWSPLASGLLTGKYTSKDPKDFPKDSRLGTDNPNYAWLKNQLSSGDGLNGLEEKNLDTILSKVSQLQKVAEELKCTLAQLSIAWCVLNPNVSTIITGASRPSQVVENFKSLEVVPKLTAAVVERIEKILNNKPKAARNWRG